MSKELIQALKENKYPFGLMTDEMQEKAKEIGPGDFSMYIKDNTWVQCGDCNNFHTKIVTDKIYRLRSDYVSPEDKPEVVECEVFFDKKDFAMKYRGQLSSNTLDVAIRCRDFASFESEGILYGRLYKDKETGDIVTWIRKDALDCYDVLPVDNVLFWSKP